MNLLAGFIDINKSELCLEKSSIILYPYFYTKAGSNNMKIICDMVYIARTLGYISYFSMNDKRMIISGDISLLPLKESIKYINTIYSFKLPINRKSTGKISITLTIFQNSAISLPFH